MKKLTIVHVAREFNGYAEGGGVKDCTSGLARAAAKAGHSVHVILPYYRGVEAALAKPEAPRFSRTATFSVPLHYRVEEPRCEAVEIHSGKLLPNLQLHLVLARRFRFFPEGTGEVPRDSLYTYSPAEAIAVGRPADAGRAHFDFFCVNGLLVKAALRACELLELRPDLVHCHDGHTSLFPMLAQASHERLAPSLADVPVLTTIHNAGAGYHQDVADLEFAAACCGVSPETIHGCLLQGRFDPLVAAGLFGHQVVWVSENYCREVTETGEDQRTGWLGHRLLAMGVPMLGITNGIDEDCSSENGISLGLAARFSLRCGDMGGKVRCKQELLRSFAEPTAVASPSSCPGMPLRMLGRVADRPELPLLTFVGRLDSQKGLDVLVSAVEKVFREDQEVQLIGLGGNGDPAIERSLVRLTEVFNGRVGLAIGHSGAFANKIFAGGDFFIIPSRFEPCCLTDFMAQLMLSVPLAHKCGGLTKIRDGRHGLTYRGDVDGLVAAIHRALSLYRQPNASPLRKIQQQAVANIRRHFTWEKVFRNGYLPAYQAAIARAQPRTPYEARTTTPRRHLVRKR